MDDLQELGAWAISHGGTVHPDAEFAMTPESGSFLRAKGNGPGISVKSKAITCPHSITVSHLNALNILPFKSHGPQFPQSFLKCSTIHTIDVFFLCQQYLLGDKSFWRPYIRTLPQPHDKDSLDTPLWYNEEDKRWLLGTNMEKGYMDREKDWKERWTAGVEMLQESDWSTAGYTWELACWAATIFSSRSFVSNLLSKVDLQNLKDDSVGSIISRDDPFPVLFPLIDILNHSPTTRIEWITGPSTLSLVILDKASPGQPIMNNYGPKSNEELLLGYGFCLNDNPFDHVGLRFKPPLTPKQQSILESTQSRSAIMELPSDNVYYIHTSPRDNSNVTTNISEFSSFDTRLVILMGILVSNHSEAEIYRSSPQLGSRGRLAVAMQLKEALRHKIKAIRTYDDILPPKPTNKCQEYAKIYRDSQLHILESSLEPLENALAEASLKTTDQDGVPNLLNLRSAIKVLQHKNLYTDWKRFLEQSFGSTSITKLRNAGWEDTLWVLWLGLVYMTRNDTQEDRVSTTTVHAWLDQIIIRYYDPSSTEDYTRIVAMTSIISEEEVDELIGILTMHSDSLEIKESFFTRPGWNRQVITWACLIVHEESLRIHVGAVVLEQLFLYIGDGPRSQ